jgi:hypothetical protein
VDAGGGGRFFIYWKNLVASAKPSKERPVVLLLENHDWYLFIDTIDYCKQNGVTFLIFPPHCSHKHQPLEISVSGSLMRHVENAYDSCITYNPGSTIKIYDIPSVVNILLVCESFSSKYQNRYPEFWNLSIQRGYIFKTKNLWNLTLQTELLLLWRQQFPIATVNFLRF